MSHEGLKKLPDGVVAPLLRALMCLPAPRGQLSLRLVDRLRPPVRHGYADYEVLWRGQIIGRMWQHHYELHPWEHVGDWHWDWHDVPGRPDSAGHASSLEAAMAEFRLAWDARERGVA